MARDTTSDMNKASIRGALNNDKTNAMNSGKGVRPNPGAKVTDQAQNSARKIGDFTKIGDDLFKRK